MSTSMAWRLGGVLIAVAALAGCRSKPAAEKAPAEPAKAESPKEAPKAEGAPAAEAAKAEPRAEEPKAPSRGGDAPSKGGDPALGELSQDARRLQDQRSFLVQKYTELADDAYASGDWEKARSRYSDVLDLDGRAHV